MLAAQMAGTRGRSLGEVRDARDSMMQSVWSMPQGGAVEFVQEGSVQLEVVSAPGACAVSEAALLESRSGATVCENIVLANVMSPTHSRGNHRHV